MGATLVAELINSNLVDAADVARVTDASPRSVVRWQAGDVEPRRDTEERLLELQAVLDLASSVFRPEVARRWLRSPVPQLDYRKPLDLIASGQWRTVVNALVAFQEGVTA